MNQNKSQQSIGQFRQVMLWLGTNPPLNLGN